MARLTDDQVRNLLKSKEWEAIDISSYTNKDSNLLIKGKCGHIINASLNNVLNSKFRCPKCYSNDSIVTQDTLKLDGPPPKKGYRIVGIDQASHICGVSVWDNGTLVYYNYYSLQGKDLDERLVHFAKLVGSVIIQQWEADYIQFEDIQNQDDSGGNILTFKTLAETLGVGCMVAAMYNVDHSAVLNKVWQSEFAIAGSTRIAQKASVVKRVKEYFNIDVQDDIADAILIGRWAVNQLHNRWMERIF